MEMECEETMCSGEEASEGGEERRVKVCPQFSDGQTRLSDQEMEHLNYGDEEMKYSDEEVEELGLGYEQRWGEDILGIR